MVMIASATLFRMALQQSFTFAQERLPPEYQTSSRGPLRWSLLWYAIRFAKHVFAGPFELLPRHTDNEDTCLANAITKALLYMVYVPTSDFVRLAHAFSSFIEVFSSSKTPTEPST